MPAGVISDQFSQYVATDHDVQTAADITDREMCTGQQQVAGDAEVSGDANGSVMDQEADNDAPCHTAWLLPCSLDTVWSYLAVSPCCRPSYA